jgi:hypothetical protein
MTARITWRFTAAECTAAAAEAEAEAAAVVELSEEHQQQLWCFNLSMLKALGQCSSKPNGRYYPLDTALLMAYKALTRAEAACNSKQQQRNTTGSNGSSSSWDVVLHNVGFAGRVCYTLAQALAAALQCGDHHAFLRGAPKGWASNVAVVAAACMRGLLGKHVTEAVQRRGASTAASTAAAAAAAASGAAAATDGKAMTALQRLRKQHDELRLSLVQALQTAVDTLNQDSSSGLGVQLEHQMEQLAAAKRSLLDRLQQALVVNDSSSSSSSSGLSSSSKPADVGCLADASVAGAMQQHPTADASVLQWVQQLRQYGAVLCALVPLSHCCNNPGCGNLGGPSEAGLVSSKGSRCSSCWRAYYCSRACQMEHWNSRRGRTRRCAGCWQHSGSNRHALES